MRERPPLAPLAALTPAVAEDNLEDLRAAIKQTTQLDHRARDELLALTFFIAGRRFPEDLQTSVLWSKAVEESSTYRYVVERGRVEGRAEGLAEGQAAGQAAGLRRVIRDLVAARVETVPEGLEQHLTALDAERLYVLFTRVLRAGDEELLALIEGD